MRVANPWHRCERREEDGHDRDGTKSDDGGVLGGAGAIHVYDLHDEPCDTGGCATGVNTTQVL